MTDAQLRWHQLMEDKRHNVAQEANWDAQVAETRRADLAREGLSRYATDVQKWATEVQAETSRYNAELNAATNRYAVETQTEASRDIAQLNAQTSRYSTDVNASTQRQRTAIEAARLDFDRKTQQFKNDLESKRVTLQEMATHADVELTRAKAISTLQGIKNDLTRLKLEADRLEMDQESRAIENELNEMRTLETGVKTARNASQGIRETLDWIIQFMS